MHLSFAAFTREAGAHANEDRIVLPDDVVDDGRSRGGESGSCCAFVTEGVGGSPAGQLASAFVLAQAAERFHPSAGLIHGGRTGANAYGPDAADAGHTMAIGRSHPEEGSPCRYSLTSRMTRLRRGPFVAG